MSKVLVTGGAGMIGANLVRRLVAAGYDVTVVDNLWRGRREYLLNVDGRGVIDMEAAFFPYDLSQPDALDPLLPDVEYVFHLADVVAGIGYVFNNQANLFRQNLLINTNVVANVSRFTGIKGYIYVGTACSFPAHLQTGVDAPPLVEDDLFPAAPESAYGWSKLMGHYEAELLEQEFGIPVALPILHNVYGAPCDYGKERSQVIPALVRRAIENPVGSPFVVWGSGNQGRAFIHVSDVVDGLMACMDHGLGKGPIQLGPDKCTSIRDVAETVVEISGKSIEIDYDATKPEGDRGRCADYAKAWRKLGWKPRTPLRDGIAEVYEFVEAGLAAESAAAV